MLKQVDLPRSTAEIVEAFVLSRRRSALVSTAEAIRAVRFLASCKQTDRELAELVASIAVRHGRSVLFE